MAHNKAKGACVWIDGDELRWIQDVSIINPLALVDSCTYTLPIDSLGYLMEFGNRYSKVGVGYVHLINKVPSNDSLMQYEDPWEADVLLVLVE